MRCRGSGRSRGQELGERLGSLSEGKRANLLIFSGDPFQPDTKLDAVMLDGKFVSGDMDQ